MNVNGKHYRTIWLKEDDPSVVCIINQIALPFRFEILELKTSGDVRRAIKDMYVRGAGLIGAAAAFGMYLAALEARTESPAAFNDDIEQSAALLKATRPTASNLAWAVDKMLSIIRGAPPALRSCSVPPGAGLADGTIHGAFSSPRSALDVTPSLRSSASPLPPLRGSAPQRPAFAEIRAAAQAIADGDAEACRRIGEHGLEIIKKIAATKGGGEVNILTHCNAGWLAFVDHGSALSPVYAACDAGINVHVWVDETRPRNQGASLTAWELGQHGVKHDLIPDNAGGHLMQHGLVDMVITGADRVTRCGDAANKIGTYLKAVAAKDNGVPFYVALPSSTFDFAMRDGVKEIPIEERDAAEVRFMSGKTASGQIETVQICPDSTPARNWGFDVTPARCITGLISERGVCAANENAILALYPEQA